MLAKSPALVEVSIRYALRRKEEKTEKGRRKREGACPGAGGGPSGPSSPCPIKAPMMPHISIIPLTMPRIAPLLLSFALFSSWLPGLHLCSASAVLPDEASLNQELKLATQFVLYYTFNKLPFHKVTPGQLLISPGIQPETLLEELCLLTIIASLNP